MALASRPAAASGGALLLPPRTHRTRRPPRLLFQRPARRRNQAASATAQGGDGGDDDARSAAPAAPTQQQQPPQTWGYCGDGGDLAWTFDDDAGAASASSSGTSSLKLAAPPSPPSVVAGGAARRPAAEEEDPLVVLSRLPEQLSDPRALTRGVLLVDKPAGWTAGDVVRAVRWALRGGGGGGGGGGGKGRAARPPPSATVVAHAGALDRHATGLVALCLGAESAALLTPRCASLERVYAGTITLGVETATWDAWARDEGRGARAAGGVAAAMAAVGAAAAAAAADSSSSLSSLPPPSAEVVDTMPWEHVTDEAIAAAAAALCGGRASAAAGSAVALVSGPPPADGDRGLLLQPAPRSGGKRAGRAAAWYEERGASAPAALPARRVPVRELAVWRERGAVLGFRLAAGPGASPRALAHALGEALGTCAHLSSLRREALGALSAERAWPLDALLPALQAGRGGALRAAARRRQSQEQRTR